MLIAAACVSREGMVSKGHMTSGVVIRRAALHSLVGARRTRSARRRQNHHCCTDTVTVHCLESSFNHGASQTARYQHQRIPTTARTYRGQE
jgi:hypothetical protein